MILAGVAGGLVACYSAIFLLFLIPWCSGQQYCKSFFMGYCTLYIDLGKSRIEFERYFLPDIFVLQTFSKTITASTLTQ